MVGEQLGEIRNIVASWGEPASGVCVLRESHASMLYRTPTLLVRVSPSELQAKREVLASRVQLTNPSFVLGECLYGPTLLRDGGQVTGWRWVERYRATTVFDVAEFAAKLYGVAAPAQLAGESPVDRINDYMELIEEQENVASSNLKTLRKSQDKAQEIWSRYSQRDIGFIHGDLSVANIIVGEGRTVGVDLETAGVGPQGWDVTHVLGAYLYGASPLLIRNAYQRYRACGGQAEEKIVRRLVFVKIVAGATWAVAHRHLSERHATEAAVRLKALDSEIGSTTPKWTLL